MMWFRCFIGLDMNEQNCLDPKKKAKKKNTRFCSLHKVLSRLVIGIVPKKELLVNLDLTETQVSII